MIANMPDSAMAVVTFTDKDATKFYWKLAAHMSLAQKERPLLSFRNQLRGIVRAGQ
jgi:hypothetical protein